MLGRGTDGAALGCVALRPLDASTCEMKRLYVRPEGRGTGLGRALVAAVLAQAAALGYREIKLDTLPQLKTAIALYRSFGIEPVPPYGDHPFAGTLCFGKVL